MKEILTGMNVGLGVIVAIVGVVAALLVLCFCCWAISLWFDPVTQRVFENLMTTPTP